MLDFKERTRVRKVMYAKPTILLVLLLSALSLRGAWGMWEKSKDAKSNRDKAVATELELAAHAKELHADITVLSSPRGQEEEIRNRFMVAKDGEKVIIISEPADGKEHTVTVDDVNKTSTLVDRLKAAVGLSGN